MVTVAILGLGGRGYHTYAQYQKLYPDRMKIVAIAEISKERLDLVREEFSVPKENCFSSAEELLQQERLADVLFVCTQDQQHREHAIQGMKLGYEILLEKPIATNYEDVMEILVNAKRYQRSVTVCHVLRYTKFFGLIKQLIDDGEIGRVFSINAEENVGYWHQVHSFVRGNWRKEEDASPMLLQKCCHDLDIFNWLLGKKCISVSSVGALSWFKAENAPEGCSERCSSCKYKNECPYSAYKIYIEHPLIGYNCGRRTWPLNILCSSVTAENLHKAIEEGPYGQCVYHCDNDVVDHQTLQLLYEDDVTITFQMTGFTADNKRVVKIMGSKGEIYADQMANTVQLAQFGKPKIIYDITKLTDDLSGHSGGDNEMLTRLFDGIEHKNGALASSIDQSVHSHVIVFASEYSCKRGGERIYIDDFNRLQNQE